MNKKNKLIFGLALLTTLSLTGCANNEQPSNLNGHFGVELGQQAGTLSVTGYNDDYSFMTINPPEPDHYFNSYSVRVNRGNNTVSSVTGVTSVKSIQDCQKEKWKLFDSYKEQYLGQYRQAGTLSENTNYIGFDNANIQISCGEDLSVSYSLN